MFSLSIHTHICTHIYFIVNSYIYVYIYYMYIIYIYPLTEIRKTGYWKHRPNRFKLYPQIKMGQNQTNRMRHLIPKYPQLPSVQWHILKSEIQGQQGAESRNPRLCKQWNAVLGLISYQLHINHWEFRTCHLKTSEAPKFDIWHTLWPRPAQSVSSKDPNQS